MTPRFHRTWYWTQIGVLILPLVPALGIVALAIAVVLTGKEQWRPILHSPPNWVLAIVGLWLLVSSWTALEPTEALLGLANFLPFFVLFAALSGLIKTPDQLRRLAWLMVLPALPIAILGVGQLYGGWATNDLSQKVLGWRLVAYGEPTGRMSSVFIYANFLAAYLLLVGMLALGLGVETYRSWQRGHPHPGRGLLLLLILALCGTGILLSSSRSAWAIACLGGLAFALYLGWYRLVWGVAAAAASILWASFGTWGRDWLRRIVPAFFWARLSDRLYPDRPLASLRVTQWQFAWEMTQQRPWLGWGLRNFTPLYETHMNWWLGHPHNLALMLTAETGIPAALLLIGVVGWILSCAVLRLREEALGGDRLILFSYVVAFGSCSLFNLLDVTVYDLRVNTMGWLVLSAIYGVVRGKMIASNRQAPEASVL
ncbi:MAG: O-antigen ligase family protein [Cyanophyceae cyanobacterium]